LPLSQRIAAWAVAVALAAGAAAEASSERSDALLAEAKQLRASGQWDRALQRTRMALTSPDVSEAQAVASIRLRAEILEERGRSVEGAALRDYLARHPWRAEAGGAPPQGPITKEACIELHQKRSPGDELRVKWKRPTMRARPTFPGRAVASYSVDAQGGIRDIRLLDATSFLVAVHAIETLAISRAATHSVQATSPELFPVKRCEVFDYPAERAKGK